ncbi:hypothetical protein QZH41_006646 [Actinostola sp. cb2023]|nr:hypothetical protein QZH41_006646 [Actinostola sp. cb2023]
MSKLEKEIIQKHSPTFYNRYVDDCITKRKTTSPDLLLQDLNSYHQNIVFTVEENPSHFLDTAFQYKDNGFSTSTYNKPGKLPTHWKSAIPIKWKRNTLRNALHRTIQITSNWKSDLQNIINRFQHAGYPWHFIQKVIHEFEYPSEPTTIIPTNWFDERRPILIRIPYCQNNEHQSRSFVRKLERFTRGQYKFIIIWKTKKMSSLFQLKDKNIHKSHVIYHGTCMSCSATYVGETARNADLRFKEHSTPNSQSEPAHHCTQNPNHKFEWNIISTSYPLGIRKTLEALYIAKLRPDLNKQVKSYHLNLFPRGIT